jgi:hypothetical protein
VVVRDRSAEVVESMLSQAGASNLHAAFSTWSGLCCGFVDVLRALLSPLEMASGWGGVSTMEWCRDGGGCVVESGQPCLHWLPSCCLENDPPARYCDYADAFALCSNFSHVSVPVRAADCRCWVRDVWTSLLQRVVLVTKLCYR